MAAFGFGTGVARGIGRMVALAAMALAGLLAAGVAGAQTYTVARTSHTILLADDAHADPHLCNYAAYRITADAAVTDVWATIGIHPNEADEHPAVDAAKLVARAAHPRVVGLGEKAVADR